MNFMKCSKCNKHQPIIEMQHGKYCEFCFIKYFEKKVYDTIIKYNLINKNERIGVAVSGGKDSLTVLYLVNKFMQKHHLRRPIAVSIDEGIKGYRTVTLKKVKTFCKRESIPLKIISYKKQYKNTLDEFIEKIKNKKLNIHSCNVCGVLRRQTLNKTAKELKLDKLITGHNLDDESQTILMNFLKGNKDILPRQGIITEMGRKKGKSFVKRVKPLYFLTDKEVRLYTYLKGFDIEYTECPYAEESYRNDVEKLLNNFEDKYKGTKNAIANTFLSILPKIKQISDTEINTCKVCGEPANKEICKACELLEKIK